MVWRNDEIHKMISFFFFFVKSGYQSRMSDQSPREFPASRFWLVHILFVSKDEFQSFAQFPVDYLSNPVVSSFVYLLFLYATLVYYEINCFIAVTTYFTLACQLCTIINFRFDIISPDGIVLCWYCFTYLRVFPAIVSGWFFSGARVTASLLKSPGLVWFGGFNGISTFVGYITPNPFLCK